MSDSAIPAHKKYALLLLAVFGLLACATLGINLMVDPLWFWKGNQITGANFKFNERESKLNHLLRHKDDYDCLIFGSSRATFFQGDVVPGHRCFNLAFGSGQPGEFVAIGQYLLERGFTPDLVIVGVDGFTFHDTDRDPINIPGYVLKNEAGPGVLRAYLTADALRFSILTLLDKSPHYGYYDAHFRGAIRADAPRFKPDASLEGEGLRRANAAARNARPFNPAYAEHYGRLVEAFPSSTVVGYVPPVSAWHIGRMDRLGVLDGYIRSLHATSRLFKVFWDFSIPSRHTWRTDNTYDGSHYDVPTNRLIAVRVFLGAEETFGVSVCQLDLGAYAAIYRQALAEFRRGQGL